MRVAIVGSRIYTDYLLFTSLLEETLEQEAIDLTVVVSGGADGVDTFAELWASTHEIPTDIYRPDYTLGRGAPLARNTQIVAAADVVIAFPLGKSNGTRDSMRKARAAGKRLFTIN